MKFADLDLRSFAQMKNYLRKIFHLQPVLETKIHLIPDSLFPFLFSFCLKCMVVLLDDDKSQFFITNTGEITKSIRKFSARREGEAGNQNRN